MNKKRKPINKKTRELVKQKTNGNCAYCGCSLPEKFHIDHILPIAHCHGTNDISNLFAACIQCNNYKTVYTIEQFRRQLQRQVEMAKRYAEQVLRHDFSDVYGGGGVHEKRLYVKTDVQDFRNQLEKAYLSGINKADSSFEIVW